MSEPKLRIPPKYARLSTITGEVLFRKDRIVLIQRMQNDRNMTLEDIKRIDTLQKWSYFSAFYPEGRRNHLVCHELHNNGDKADLLEPLDEILARDIVPTPRQKYALYERYLRESPEYCKENAWCYSFYNMGGCKSCPFPCGHRQALFERAEGLAAESETAD